MRAIVVRNDLLETKLWAGTELLKLLRRSHAAFADQVRYNAGIHCMAAGLSRGGSRFGRCVWAQAFEFDADNEELSTLIRYADEPPEASELFHRADQRLG